MKITNRDLTAFLLGVVVMILIQFFSDFKNNVQSFKEGFKEAIGIPGSWHIE